MTIIIADDRDTNRKLLRVLLRSDGYTIIEVDNGVEALAALEGMTEPTVGLIDWEMPGIDGIEVCRRARQRAEAPPLFLILLTVRDSRQDIVTGLQNGANDYITKPFDQKELLARVKVGIRLVELQQTLIDQARELHIALEQVKQLGGLLPICTYCKKIRDDKNYWQQVETYIGEHSEAQFSHGICPECVELHIRPQMVALGLKPPEEEKEEE